MLLTYKLSQFDHTAVCNIRFASSCRLLSVACADFTDYVLTEVVNNKNLGPTCAIVCYPRVQLTRVETSTNMN